MGPQKVAGWRFGALPAAILGVVTALIRFPDMWKDVF